MLIEKESAKSMNQSLNEQKMFLSRKKLKLKKIKKAKKTKKCLPINKMDFEKKLKIEENKITENKPYISENNTLICIPLLAQDKKPLKNNFTSVEDKCDFFKRNKDLLINSHHIKINDEENNAFSSNKLKERFECFEPLIFDDICGFDDLFNENDNLNYYYKRYDAERESIKKKFTDIFRDSNYGSSFFNLNLDYSVQLNQKNNYFERFNINNYLNIEDEDKESIGNMKKKLTKTKFKEVLKLGDSNKKCTICFEEFQDNDNTYTLSCDHIFHVGCFNKEIKYRQKCPICRKKL